MDKVLYTILVVVIILLSSQIFSCSHEDKGKGTQSTVSVDALSGRKVLYLDSYHEEYAPNGLGRAAFQEIANKRQLTVKYLYLDAKRVKDTTRLAKRGRDMRDSVMSWKPDLIVAADDAVNQYVISRFFLNADIPVVFNGVNWSVEKYGYPAKNITGQIEVDQIERLVQDLNSHASGTRIGILTGNTMTDKKNIDHYKNIIGVSFHKEVLVDSFVQWQEAFREMQKSTDILILRHSAGIAGWDESDAMKLVREETMIPTGSISRVMEHLVLLTYPKMNAEYGEYSAKTAIRILEGKAPADIPHTRNIKTHRAINMTLAEKLGITFDVNKLEDAHLITIPQKRILFVNSYHRGYIWSDNIETGLVKSLKLASTSGREYYFDEEKELKIVRMDTKRNTSEEFKKSTALRLKKMIDTWNPDVIIAADDNASKYLIKPYFMESDKPIIFCGLNWDESVYGFPTDNIRGMVEVAPVKELIEFMKKYSKGDRVGFLGSDVYSERKEFQHYREVLGIKVTKDRFVTSGNEWKEAFLDMQKSVDILILQNVAGIMDWDSASMANFVKENTKIPTGSTSSNVRYLTLVSYSRLGEEQGWWSGRQGEEVLKGKSIREVPVVYNKEFGTYINMTIANNLNIKFPADLLEKVVLINGGS